ncbi:hypothetical protein DFJ74DRAFT_771228 [Hyaloraphidium curvatum]|nr:hypothetical protein DFJ74DRAFT_771228 [Hyaloraphidium curvatum]
MEAVRDALATVGLTPVSAAAIAGVAYSLLRIRRWAAGGKVAAGDLKKDLTGKTFVVTGGCGGIGIETVKQLALQGATVVAAARDYQKSHDYLNAMLATLPPTLAANVSFEAIDLADLDSVRAFAKRYIDSGRDIDVLINNAGIMALPERATSAQGFELQMATNHLAHTLLTYLLLDVIKKTAAKKGGARIINVSSGAHRMGAINWDDFENGKKYVPWKTYGDTKLANIMVAVSMAWNELKGTGVVINALHPGAVRTELARHSMKGREWLVPFFLPLIYLLLKSPWEGAQTTLHLAVSDEGGIVTGAYFADCKRAALMDKLGQSSRPEEIEKLMEVTKQKIGL